MGKPNIVSGFGQDGNPSSAKDAAWHQGQPGRGRLARRARYIKAEKTWRQL